jgi:hypothetical protein
MLASEVSRLKGVTTQAVTLACRSGLVPGAVKLGPAWWIPRTAAEQYSLARKAVSEHGTRSRYVAGCQCGPCRRANAQDEAARRRRLTELAHYY